MELNYFLFERAKVEESKKASRWCTYQDVVVETWVAESAATAVTWTVVGLPDSREPDCGDDWRAMGPVVAAPSDWGPAAVASARAAATSSSCYKAHELRLSSPTCHRRSSRHHPGKDARHPCTVCHGSQAAPSLLCGSLTRR